MNILLLSFVSRTIFENHRRHCRFYVYRFSSVCFFHIVSDDVICSWIYWYFFNCSFPLAFQINAVFESVGQRSMGKWNYQNQNQILWCSSILSALVVSTDFSYLKKIDRGNRTLHRKTVLKTRLEFYIIIIIKNIFVLVKYTWALSYT